MKEVILHIGLHKTGSTSIQKALKGYKKNGVKSIAFEEENHSIPMYTIFSENRYNYHIWKNAGLCKDDIDKKRDEYFDILKSEFKVNNSETLIISGEDLSVLNNSEVKALSEFFRSQQVVTKIICYVREPLSWIVSAAQQQIKMGRHISNLDNIYKSRLENYIQYFGKKNIRIFEYQKTIESENSIVTHFSRTLSIDLKDPKRTNQSISPLQFSLIHCLNKLQLQSTRHQTWHAIVQKIMKIDHIYAANGIEKLDNQYFINHLPKFYKDDCDWLQKEFNIRYKKHKVSSHKNINDYLKIILSNSLEEISSLFKEIGIIYDPNLSLTDNFLNAFIFIDTGVGDFNGDLYLKLNPDVKDVKANPYMHYLIHGNKKGRSYQ